MSKLEEKLFLLRRHQLRFGFVRNYWRKRAKSSFAENIVLLEHDLLCRIDAKDSATRRLWLKGNFSPELAWVIRKYVARGSTVIDVGANVGLIAIQLAHFTGPEGQVVCFEANATIIARLRDNMTINGFSHVEIHAKACGPEDGSIGFSADPANHSLSKVTADGERVAMTSIDRVLAESTRRVSLIKIDVEGYEAEVLAGARATLKKHRPAVVFETGMHSDEQIRAIQSHLAECRYQVLGVVEEWGIEVKPLSPRMTELSHCNVLALPTL